MFLLFFAGLLIAAKLKFEKRGCKGMASDALA